ncbi:MAG TPA: sugar transferase, partial [Anaerolineae bacterium]|nr:sugar transferase [Anaerolineae bacterium]
MNNIYKQCQFFEKTENVQNIFSIDDFHSILKSERFRSDRAKADFSLITFDVRLLEKDKNLTKHLLDTLTSRVRITDTVGWLGKLTIAVLLPDTSSKGAWMLAETICKGMTAFAPTPIYTIYAYPSQKWNTGKNIPEQSSFIEKMNSKITVSYQMPLWKRIIDIFGSLTGLILFSPFFIFVSTIIKLVSPGPVFFKQKRIGHSGKIFTFLKFRTMHTNNDDSIHRQYLKELINGDNNGERPMEKLENDSRIIPMGSFLRKTCIDELPQLINVLLGDMSLVGPRPCIPYEAEEYLRWHTRRFDIVPGMTGLWQIRGKNKTTFKEMIRLDIQYAERLSFWLDIKILFKTPLVIMSQICK